MKQNSQYDFPLLTPQSCADIAIVGNGDFPTHPIPLSLLRNAAHLCCCDGAGADVIQRGYRPDAIVGDGDSLSATFRKQYADIIHIVHEQEYNDLTKTLRFSLSHFADASLPPTVALLGVTGKREDHTLGNISLLNYYASTMSVRPMVVTDYGWFVMSSGRASFESFPRQQVSIFNIDCSRLESDGLRWQSYAYRELWQGTLNASTGRSFILDGDRRYMVFRTFAAKPED